MKATTTSNTSQPARPSGIAMESASGGEQPERLAKTLKARWVWAIALGSAVGWGAFILPTDWLAIGGPVGALSGFMIGGALMILIAVSYGFLIKSFPVSGGELAFALVGFGRTRVLLRLVPDPGVYLYCGPERFSHGLAFPQAHAGRSAAGIPLHRGRMGCTSSR